MTPTLFGRLQTRLFLTVVIGGLVTLAVTPLLPGRPGYAATIEALLVILGLGFLLWEPLYHALQQFRWEKDWPLGFGLVTVVNEGLVAYWLLDVPASTYVAQLAIVWFSIWAIGAGPLRIVTIRWRFSGGQFFNSVGGGN